MNSKARTLYVSDLDGTLLNTSSVVSPRSHEMLNRAIADGALFTVATARTPATVSTLLDGIHMTLPAVVMTGAALWDASTGIYSDIYGIPADTVRGMVEIYRECGTPTFIYRLVNGKIEIYHYGELSETERQFLAERIDNPYKHFESLDCQPDGVPNCLEDVVLFYAMQPDDKARAAYERIKTLPVTPLCYHDIFGPETSIVEVFGPQTTKANAVRRLARNIGAERIISFGDNVNDLPLMEIADVAVAVGNAVPEARQAADIVIDTNDTDAVARFILDDMNRQQ